jgi:hypothetical protein
VEINTTNGTVLNTFNAPVGTDSLNDISYDTNQSVLYVSDSSVQQVWKMTTTGVFTLAYDTEGGTNDAQNGVYVDGRKLIMQGQKGNLKSMNLDTNVTTIISSSIDDINIDGIWNYKDKGYMVSDWSGKIYFVNNDGTSKLLLTTNPIRSADISYSSELGLLLVPDFDKKIIAYEVK